MQIRRTNQTFRQKATSSTMKKINACAHAVALVLTLANTASITCAEEVPNSTPEVNLNDSKITATEKNLDQIQTQAANTFVKQQAEVLNTVPGVEITPAELKEEPSKNGFSLNPVNWVFAPVIKLQEQTVRLQQQMIKLTGPIAALQPAMLTLQERVESMSLQLTDVQTEMHEVRKRMHRISGRLDQTVEHITGVDSNLTKVSGQMGSVQSSLSGTYSVLRKMGPDLKNVRLDIGKIRDPIAKMQRPLEAIASPIQNLDREVTLVGREMKQLRVPLTLMEKPVTSLDKQLTGLHSEISELRSLLALVLTSIFVAAGLSAVGTPIAAILVWRNKNKFLPKLKPGESSEDNLVGAGATAGSRRL